MSEKTSPDRCNKKKIKKSKYAAKSFEIVITITNSYAFTHGS